LRTFPPVVSVLRGRAGNLASIVEPPTEAVIWH
jgi:hypothetical protein